MTKYLTFLTSIWYITNWASRIRPLDRDKIFLSSLELTCSMTTSWHFLVSCVTWDLSLTLTGKYKQTWGKLQVLAALNTSHFFGSTNNDSSCRQLTHLPYLTDLIKYFGKEKNCFVGPCRLWGDRVGRYRRRPGPGWRESENKMSLQGGPIIVSGVQIWYCEDLLLLSVTIIYITSGRPGTGARCSSRLNTL